MVFVWRSTILEPRFLILETSHRRGFVAVSAGDCVVDQRILEEARRHCRDLVPQVKALLDEQHWKPRELTGVIVSRGPGSYTGLRVGIMSAKTFAYITKCALIAVDTFAAIAEQAPIQANVIDVISDAQQEKVYVQRFRRENHGWHARSELAIRPLAEWTTTLDESIWVTGPGLENVEPKLAAGIPKADRIDWTPNAESLLRQGLDKWRQGEMADPFTLEPLYLRPSAAEEKWIQKK